MTKTVAAKTELERFLIDSFDVFEHVRESHDPILVDEEFGTVTYVGQGITRLQGLPSAQMNETLRFENGLLGMVFNLDTDEVGCVLLGESSNLHAGSKAFLTGSVLNIPVGDELLGRVLNAAGMPLDGLAPLTTRLRMPVERGAPSIMHRLPVTQPLQTGIKAIDAILPIGRGQRELILGDRQTGKSAIALDATTNQRDKDVICVTAVSDSGMLPWPR